MNREFKQHLRNYRVITTNQFLNKWTKDTTEIEKYESWGTRKVNLTYDYFVLHIYSNGTAFYSEELAKNNGKTSGNYYSL